MNDFIKQQQEENPYDEFAEALFARFEKEYNELCMIATKNGLPKPKNPNTQKQQKSNWLRSEIEKLEEVKEKVERVRLDVDVIICDCGEPYKDSDLDLSVGELEQALTSIITRYKEELKILESK